MQAARSLPGQQRSMALAEAGRATPTLRRSTTAGRVAARAAAGAGSRGPRGVLILPGLGNNAGDYKQLSAALEQQGFTTAVAEVSRLDWSRNAAALTDINWWKGTLKPRPAVDWYLNKVDAAMQGLKKAVDGAPITVLTHSAGGWLGRVYLLDWGTTGVDRFVSLGSPHQAPPKDKSGVVDQTRGILTWINEASPGAYHSSIQYTTIAGKFVQGVELSGEGGILAKFAGAGYQQVCGQADVHGDFIVPCQAAHLEGAVQVDLEGCFHSPLGEKLPFFGPWYGSEAFLNQWVHYLDGSAPSTAPTSTLVKANASSRA